MAKNSISVKECLLALYSRFPLEYEVKAGIFYEFMANVFEDFISILETIDGLDLEYTLKSENTVEHFCKPCSQKRFINCMKKVCGDFLNVLALCYRGDVLRTHQLLRSMLYTNKYRSYLPEPYINYLEFDIGKENKIFYRMRDLSAKDNEIPNCWHVPYEMRSKVFARRYSLLGYPCLYLADSKETCDAELGALDKSMQRWVGEFELKDAVLLYDLRIPTAHKIQSIDTPFDLFKYLIRYPLLAICSSKSGLKSYDFHEEYYIPQLLLHNLLISNEGGTSHIAIAYSSMKHNGGYNLVFPAMYKTQIPPSSGFSPILQGLFISREPIIYRTNN